MNGGTECEVRDQHYEERSCNPDPCRHPAPPPPTVACEGSWDSWSPCTAECGGGTQRKQFRISQPAANRGIECEFRDQHYEERSCNPDPCPQPDRTPSPEDNEPQQGARPSDIDTSAEQNRCLAVEGAGSLHVPNSDVICDPGQRFCPITSCHGGYERQGVLRCNGTSSLFSGGSCRPVDDLLAEDSAHDDDGADTSDARNSDHSAAPDDLPAGGVDTSENLPADKVVPQDSSLSSSTIVLVIGAVILLSLAGFVMMQKCGGKKQKIGIAAPGGVDMSNWN
eukprot:SAG31_NODE_3678_length_3996_cov_4.453682_2_plen_281_part_00